VIDHRRAAPCWFVQLAPLVPRFRSRRQASLRQPFASTYLIRRRSKRSVSSRFVRRLTHSPIASFSWIRSTRPAGVVTPICGSGTVTVRAWSGTRCGYVEGGHSFAVIRATGQRPEQWRTQESGKPRAADTLDIGVSGVSVEPAEDASPGAVLARVALDRNLGNGAGGAHRPAVRRPRTRFVRRRSAGRSHDRQEQCGACECLGWNDHGCLTGGLTGYAPRRPHHSCYYDARRSSHRPYDSASPGFQPACGPSSEERTRTRSPDADPLPLRFARSVSPAAQVGTLALRPGSKYQPEELNGPIHRRDTSEPGFHTGEAG